MRTFAKEKEVSDVLAARLLEVGSRVRVSVHSDTQTENGVERSVLFKAAVALDGSEEIVNHMADIGTDTDRAISYVGSQVEPTDGGEVRYLLFRAKIDPFKES